MAHDVVLPIKINFPTVKKLLYAFILTTSFAFKFKGVDKIVPSKTTELLTVIVILVKFSMK